MRWTIVLLLLGAVAASAQPFPASPAEGDTDVPTEARFSWRPDGSDHYEVEITNRTTKLVEQTLISATDEAYAYQLQYATRYQWRVRGIDSLDRAGKWSVAYTFTTVSQGNRPTLLYPENGAVDVDSTVTLRWEGASSAMMYEVQVDTIPGLVDAIPQQSTMTDFTVRYGGGTTVYWRVREAAVGAGPGPWSYTFSFTTRLPDVIPPSPPRLVSPPNGSADQPLTLILDWMELTEAESYSVRVAPTSQPDSIQLETTTTNSDLTITLPPSSEPWQWMVNVTTASGTSAWSAPWTFSPVAEADSSLEAPRALLPEPDAAIQAPSALDSATVHFAWWHDRADVQFVLQYATNAEFDDTSAVEMVVSATSTDVSGFPIGSKTRWRVLARSEWAESPWSMERSFTVTAPPTAEPQKMQLVTPPDLATNVPVSSLFTWTGVATAASYEIEIATDETFKELVGGFNVQTTEAIGDTLEEGRRYWWRGRAENSTGPGEWTAPFSFVTAGETTGVTEADLSTPLQVRPNPASTSATIVLEQPMQEPSVLRVVNTAGAIVQHITVSAGEITKKIDVSGLPPGRYTLFLPTAGRMIVSSIVIQR